MTDAPLPPPPEDQPPGPGYWKASDGNWYPPQAGASPAQAYANPPPTKKGGCMKWGLILGGIGLLLIVGLIALTAAGVNKAADELEEATEAENAPVDPLRPDAQKEDQRVALGESVQISGYTATVRSASFQQSLNEFQDEGFLVIEVSVQNRDDKAQPYNTFDWKLQTPNGQVIDPGFAGEQLGSGDLIKGGKVEGKIIFEIGVTKGDFFVIYKPDAFDAARGVWPVRI